MIPSQSSTAPAASHRIAPYHIGGTPASQDDARD
jgi:hypothetical protein